MEVPGMCARHNYITDQCRENRGDDGAVVEAMIRTEKAVRDALNGWPADRGVKVHIVVTVERPDHPG